MSHAPEFHCTRTCFNEDYEPAHSTRTTTNFANLARGEHRQQNLCHTLAMIDQRFNELAQWDNPTADRYAVELDIVSIDVRFPSHDVHAQFPLIELLQTHIVDQRTGTRTAGIVGNSFSSYVRDYDFSVWLLQHNAQRTEFAVPEGFGELHGKLFQQLVASETYRTQFPKPPVICISVSHNKTYTRTDNHHPILGVEYKQSDFSLTDQYFQQMGLKVRFFMPPQSKAPLAFYFQGDLLSDYSNLELIATISTMETFQKIYRPEIYNANSAAGKIYRPSLSHPDHSLTRICYDRQERSELAIKQGQLTQVNFIEPHQRFLAQWSAQTPWVIAPELAAA